jgi:hypothetical protein
MKTLNFAQRINANPEKVWQKLWDPESYKTWTKPFSSGSYYKTDSFTQGSSIHLLTPEGHGMYSIIETLEINKKLVFKHLGDIVNFEEIPITAQTENWSGALESYTIIKSNEGIILNVEVETLDSYVSSMEKLFPLALYELKQICEKYDANYFFSKTY